jgi:hypothetical protein
MEAAVYDDEMAEEYTDVACLRLTASLSSFLEYNFGSRAVEQKPLERCPLPIGLHVCQESRAHALPRYRFMEHMACKEGCFYFDPHRNVLWLSLDFTDDPQYLRDLQRCYGEKLNTIQTLLIEEAEWDENSPAGYTSHYLRPFSGLKTILVLLEDDDEDAGEDDSSQHSDSDEYGSEDSDESDQEPEK